MKTVETFSSKKEFCEHVKKLKRATPSLSYAEIIIGYIEDLKIYTGVYYREKDVVPLIGEELKTLLEGEMNIKR